MTRAPLDIAVGVLVDERGRVLIARRRPGTPGAGFWEFPGGKHEAGETIFQCLQRELAEEIGIRDIQGRPLICFAHDRGPTPVRLHVWRIDNWQDAPHGREGQQLAWQAMDDLAIDRLLPATDVILNALKLPERYLITPDAGPQGEHAWQAAFDRALAGSTTLLRLRRTDLDDAPYAALASRLVAQAHAHGKKLLLDRDAALLVQTQADGLHWPIARLRNEGRPALSDAHWFAVSAHDAAELALAVRSGADFATLSPVAATSSHPQQRPLGWVQWQALRADVALPIYALGGLGHPDLDRARAQGAQGVAAISGFWPG